MFARVADGLTIDYHYFFLFVRIHTKQREKPKMLREHSSGRDGKIVHANIILPPRT